MKLSEARKLFKDAGYKLKVQTFTFGKHASIYNLKGEILPSIFYGADGVQKWEVAINLRSSVGPVVDNDGEKIYGFDFSLDD